MTGGAIDWDNVGMPLPLEATLEKRLQDWMDSPTVEPADWVAENLKVRRSSWSGRLESANQVLR